MPDPGFEDSVIDLVAAHVLLLDRQGRILRINRHCEEATGLSESGVVLFWEALVPDAGRSAVEAAFLAGRGGGARFAIESRILCRGGEVRPVSWTCIPAPDGSIVATGVEIVPRAKEAHLRGVVEGAGDGFWVIDLRTREVRTSAGCFEMLGHGAGEIEPTFDAWRSLVHPEDYPWLEMGFLAHVGGHAHEFRSEQRLLTKDGRWQWTLIRGRVIERDGAGKPVRMAGRLSDIAARKQLEDRLRWESESNRALAELSSAVAGSAGIGGISRLVVESGRTLTESPLGFAGYIDPVLRKLVCTASPQEGERIGAELTRRVFEQGEPVLANAAATDPRWAGISTGNVPIARLLCAPSMSDGALVGLVGMANAGRDYTDADLKLVQRLADLYAVSVSRKRTEEALRQANEQLWALFEAAPLAIAVFDLAARVSLWNPAAERIFGWTANEVLGQLLPMMNSEELGNRFAEKRSRLTAGEILPAEEGKRRRKDGTLVDVSTSTSPLRDATGTVAAVMAIYEDIGERKRIEAGLAESERRYRDLFENAPIGIYRTTPDGRILMANPAIVRMLGYNSLDDALSRNLESEGFEPEYSRNEFKCRLEEDGEIRGEEAEWKRADRTGIFVRENARAIRGDDGKIAYYEGVVEDITERKLAEEALRASEARFRAVFEGAATGILILDLTGRVGESNAAAQSILGFDERELRELRYAELVLPEDLGVSESVAQAMAGGKRDHVQAELRLRRKDGGTVWIRASASLVRGAGGEPRFVIAMIDDISTRKQAEEQLKRTVDDLARSNAELQDFAYVASHDLQEPLRMVMSFMQLLKSRYRGKIDQEADEFIGYAVEGAMRMKVLIDDLLGYSRLNAKAKPFRRTSARAAFEQALLNLTVALEESGAEVIAGDLPVLAADAGQLVQLFQNLVGNAVKFRDGRTPRVRVSAERTGEGWTFSVEDNGIGVEPQHRERIFGIFERLHTKSVYPGSGVGLTVCKRIVERHSGRIWVDSEVGEGSAFRFTIPDLPCGE